MTVAATSGSARRASGEGTSGIAARAVTMAPIHAANVPSIHHTGRYHQVLPPPIASHVHGYALKGRRRTMSIALNTTVPTRPTAAAPAIPSTPRAPVRCAGRNATVMPAASTMSDSTPPRTSGRSREAARNATTATAVSTPTAAPPVVTVRKSERSEGAGAAVADMVPILVDESGRSEEHTSELQS